MGRRKLGDSSSTTGRFILKKKNHLYIKHFRVNNVHRNAGSFNSKRFLRKSQFFY